MKTVKIFPLAMILGACIISIGCSSTRNPCTTGSFFPWGSSSSQPTYVSQAPTFMDSCSAPCDATVNCMPSGTGGSMSNYPGDIPAPIMN